MTDKANNWKEPEKLWNTMFISVFLSSIIFNLSAQMSNSLLSLYAKSTGAPADQIGILMSMFALTALIFRFIAGPAMNAYNRKRLLQMAMCLFASAYLGFSFSPLIADLTGLNVIHIMMFFRLLQGIGNAFGNACMLTIVADCIPKKEFSSGIGIFSLAQSVAQAIGPTTGVFLRDTFGYAVTYRITSALMICAFIAIGLVVKVPNRGTGKMKLDLSNMIAVECLLPAMMTFFISLGFTSINSFFLVYAEERGISRASLYFTVNAFALMATKPFVSRITDKLGFAKIAPIAFAMTAGSFVLIGYSTKLWHLIVVAILNSFGYGSVQPSLQSLCLKCVPPQKRGSASSTNYVALDSATLIGPYICGKIAKFYGYVPMMWIAMAIPIIFAIVIAVLNSRKIRKIEDDFVNRNV